jgi:predicted metal-binding transcription factor (methanogenesis marker protein 9)
MLEDQSFSILDFVKAANELSDSYSLKNPNLAQFVLQDNTIDVESFKVFARKALKAEIKESIECIESALQPIRDAQALLDDKEIQQLLKD